MRLAATSVRIEAPIPGKSAIGIEVPNSAKSMVTMREIIDTPQFRDAKSKLNVASARISRAISSAPTLQDAASARRGHYRLG